VGKKWGDILLDMKHEQIPPSQLKSEVETDIETSPSSQGENLNQFSIDESIDQEIRAALANLRQLAPAPVRRYIDSPEVSAQKKAAAFSYTDRLEDIEFKNELEKVTGLYIDILSDEEKYYLLKVYDTLKPEERFKLTSYIEATSLSGARALKIYEYNPETIHKLLDMFQVLEENSDDYHSVVHAVQSFSTLDEFMHDWTKEIEQGLNPDAQDPQSELHGIGYQLQEAILSKSADLVSLLVNEEGKKEVKEEDRNKDFDNKSRKIEIAQRALVLGTQIISEFFKGDRNNGFYTFKRKETLQGQADQFSITSFSGAEYKIKMFCRALEDSNGQARLNFEIDFNTEKPDLEMKDFFEQTITRHQDNKTQTSSVLRIAIDRDTSISASPVISLDLGRSEFHGAKFSRSGDGLGNLFAEANASGNHTNMSFDPKYADEAVFADMVTRVQEIIALKK
jgi:hypothetical protein